MLTGSSIAKRLIVTALNQRGAEAQTKAGDLCLLFCVEDGHRWAVSVASQTFESGQMMVFRPGDAISVAAGHEGARLILLGGATLSGPRYIWWNFVASSWGKIEAAKEEWCSGRLGPWPVRSALPMIATNTFRCPSPNLECR
jgi:redox-sensitive bicupin YhaK (pirin superfamily)